jgi:DNA-binding MarR family transcriptional regulator
MTQDMRPKLPIGYWLKQADNLLTQQIDQAHTAEGISRSDWQILNMLKELGGASRESIFETMQTFVDAQNLNQTIAALTERGWVEFRQNLKSAMEEEFQLTQKGHQQHEVILVAQKKVRQRAMQDISEEEYATVIRVLQQIVSNLEGEPNGTT